MAAALAASLPAPAAAPAPVAPSYEAIPASMAKVVDIEAEIPLTCVQLDAMVSCRAFFMSLLSPHDSPTTLLHLQLLSPRLRYTGRMLILAS